MQGYKSIFLSKVFWGAIVTVLASIFPKLVHIGDSDQAVSALVTICGGIFTIWGRFDASTKVTLTGAPPVVPGVTNPHV
jgi:hypothetical protein